MPHTTPLQAMAALTLVVGGMAWSPLAGAQGVTPATRADLQTLSKHKVFFGHQSVGDNLLEGLQRVAKEAQVPLNVKLTDGSGRLEGAVIAHTHVAENTQPLKKLQSFERAMVNVGGDVQLALVKFCYIDFNPNTDVGQLFTEYQATVRRLKTSYPKVKLLHVTTPLTVVQTGWKASLKKLMGKAPYGLLENIKREQYNQLIRQTYGAENSVFDLAHAESTQPNGSRLTYAWNGTTVPALYPGYTDDGEHLNEAGQRQAAAAFAKAAATQLGTP